MRSPVTASQLFNGAADGYERGRPEYPPELGAWLRASMPSGQAVDLACGTGKLVRMLYGRPGPILGVEPSAAMVAAMRQSCPDIPVIRATAESLPLRAASAQLVTVGQAFHWFDTSRAIPEISRVLAVEGKLVVAWMEDDRSQPFQAELSDLVGRYNADRLPSHRNQAWYAAMAASPSFAEQPGFSLKCRFRRRMDDVVARVRSTSFVGLLNERRRNELLQAVTQLCERFGEELTTSHHCRAIAFDRR
jgi:SAM-dependent methyltransferase